MREKLRRQGIEGPPPSFLYGNLMEVKGVKEKGGEAAHKEDGTNLSHNHLAAIYPGTERWRREYGSIFTYSIGKMVVLSISHPDLLKEINLHTSLDLGKSELQKKEWKALLGDSLVWANGSSWAFQRKVVQSELSLEKSKGMVDLIVECCLPVVQSWERRVESEGGVADIRIDEDVENLAADVISRACFGSTYAQGEKIFSKLRELHQAIYTRGLTIGIPGWSYLPTKRNRTIWRLEREIESLILKVAEDRRREATAHKDFLQSILEVAINGGQADHQLESANRFIVDNCKTMYLAGHATTHVALRWTLMLLASDQGWQNRVREEVMTVLGGGFPDANSISKLKLLTMVIHESLRLYPPPTTVIREALQEMKLGSILLPKGLTVMLPVSAVHHDPHIWGPDADEFKPQRFSNGVSAACKFPQAYLPFGLGPRVCVGQHMAMVELKVMLSVILSKFSFSLSGKYRHSPRARYWMLVPEHGLDLSMRRL